MSRLAKIGDAIRDSQAFQQLRSKYDELDTETKSYVNLGAVAGVGLLIAVTVLVSLGHLRSMKSEIDEREELIGYLQRSSDQIKQLKAEQAANRDSDASSPLASFVESVVGSSGIDHSKIEVGQEKAGQEDKEARETLVEIKAPQINLRQLSRLLFMLSEKGQSRNLNVRDINIDTKNDPEGWLEASITVSDYKAK